MKVCICLFDFWEHCIGDTKPMVKPSTLYEIIKVFALKNPV